VFQTVVRQLFRRLKGVTTYRYKDQLIDPTALPSYSGPVLVQMDADNTAGLRLRHLVRLWQLGVAHIGLRLCHAHAGLTL